MRPELYDKVRLLTDRFSGDGVMHDAVGYVIEIYDDGNCEIEFSDGNGITYAQIVANADEIEPIKSTQ